MTFIQPFWVFLPYLIQRSPVLNSFQRIFFCKIWKFTEDFFFPDIRPIIFQPREYLHLQAAMTAVDQRNWIPYDD